MAFYSLIRTLAYGRKYFRSKKKRKMNFPFAFYSLIRTFAPKLIRYGKKKMALQGWATAYGT